MRVKVDAQGVPHRVIPYYGYAEPRAIYQNGQRVAGWDNVTKSGESVAFDGTYNDRLRLDIAGRELLRADYYGASGQSAQVQTTHGKNYISNLTNDWEQGSVNGVTGALQNSNSRIRTKRFFPVTGETFIGSRNADYCFAVRCYDANFSLITASWSEGFMDPNVARSISGIKYVKFVLARLSNITLTVIPSEAVAAMCQFEPGSTATSYAPFVPNSPSPDYPSPITPYLPGGTYRLPGTTLDITIPDMHGVGTALDMVVWDKISNRCWLEGKCSKKVINGSEDIRLNAVGSGYNNYQLILTDAISSTPVLQTHGTGVLSVSAPSGYFNMCVWSSNRMFFSVKTTFCADLSAFKSWLAANPVTVLYQKVAPTRSALSITNNPNSTAPELPMAALGITMPSETYPFVRHVSGNCNLQISDSAAVRQTIAIPALRSVGSVSDKLTYDGTWKRHPYIGHIASYAGETITTAYSSTTGALTTGAEVDYVLPTPADPVQLALDAPLTYPRHTEAETDGEIKAIITATAKVVV